MSLATLSRASSLDCPPRFGTERNRKRLTHGSRAAEVAAALGFQLMPWQQHVLDVALEVDPKTGRLVYRRVLLTVPRQSGKTTLLLVLFALRALGFDGPQVMTYAAQTGVDARKKFIDEHVPLLQKSPLASLFRVRMTNGHEAVLWKNGSRHHIGAGTEKSGHGTTLDLAVIDEAFAQPDGRLEQAFSPATITRPQPQLWFVSTAGKPTDTWFRGKVDAGRLADPSDGVAYFEWSAPENADPSDHEVWRRCMPALGHTVTEQTIASELAGMRDRPDEFRRAYLNQWVSTGAEDLFPTWPSPSLVDHDAASKPSAPLSLGVDIDQDRTAHISAVWTRPDGHVQGAFQESLPASHAPARCKELAAKWHGRVAVPAVLAQDFAGVPLVEVKSTAWPLACGAFVDHVTAGTIHHGNQPELNEAVSAVRWGPTSAAGMRSFQLRDSPGAGPLFALVRALHGMASVGPSVYEDRGLITL